MFLTTTDLYESSYYLCQGAHLTDVKIEERRRPTVVFHFDDHGSRPTLPELQVTFHVGKTTINLPQYRRHLEKLRDLMSARLRDWRDQREDEEDRDPTLLLDRFERERMEE